MLKTSLLFVLSLLIILITGCNNTDSPKNSKIIWGVPDFYSISEETLRGFNTRLKENDYIFEVEFVKLDMVDYTQAIYDYEKNHKSIDIFFAGFGNNQQIIGNIINDGYLEPMAAFLSNTPEIRRLYHDTQWLASSINGNNYMIPSWTTMYSVTYAFNTKYFYNEELDGFSGLPQQLSELLSKNIKNAKILITEKFSNSFLPFDYVTGAMLAHETGIAVNIFADEGYIDLVKSLNTFYKDGRLQEYSTISAISDVSDYAVCIIESADVNKFRNNGFIVWESMPVVSPMPAGLAVRADSKNKENAFELLRYIYTDSDAINILIYGIDGVDYRLDDNGYPVTIDGQYIDSFLNEMALGFGRFVNLLPSYMSSDMPGRPQSIDIDPIIYIDQYARKSPFIGFWPTIAETGEKVKTLGNTFNKYDSIQLWKNEDIDTVLARINNELNENDIDVWLNEINKQLENYWSKKRS